jgi:hypothetical protein
VEDSKAKENTKIDVFEEIEEIAYDHLNMQKHM